MNSFCKTQPIIGSPSHSEKYEWDPRHSIIFTVSFAVGGPNGVWNKHSQKKGETSNNNSLFLWKKNHSLSAILQKRRDFSSAKDAKKEFIIRIEKHEMEIQLFIHYLNANQII